MYVYVINGWTDHVHMIVAIPPKLSVADAVKNLKGASSHYINNVVRPEHLHFVWQRGYGCLTLGETQRAKAIEYVENQKDHHREKTTNAWLERYNELDEGPEDSGVTVTADEPSLKEKEAEYQSISDPWPF